MRNISTGRKQIQLWSRLDDKSEDFKVRWEEDFSLFLSLDSTITLTSFPFSQLSALNVVDFIPDEIGPPKVQNAFLSRDFARLVIVFDANVQGPKYCSKIFEQKTLDVIGGKWPGNDGKRLLWHAHQKHNFFAASAECKFIANKLQISVNSEEVDLTNIEDVELRRDNGILRLGFSEEFGRPVEPQKIQVDSAEKSVYFLL